MSESIFRDNFAFIREKKAELNNLQKDLYRDIAKKYSKEISSFSAEDIMELYASISGDSAKNTLVDLALFSNTLADNIAGFTHPLFSDGEPEAADTDHIQIAYLKNAFSDKAYRKFSELFTKASASYCPGFREVCEDIYYGRNSHAILPIYSNTEGHLASFRKLISKYDLKIVCATDILMSDDTSMRYALLSKELPQIDRNADMSVLELTVVVDNSVSTGDFLNAVEHLGAGVISATSYPLEYSEDGSMLWLQLDISKTDPCAMYLFLECCQIRYTVIGVYKII